MLFRVSSVLAVVPLWSVVGVDASAGDAESLIRQGVEAGRKGDAHNCRRARLHSTDLAWPRAPVPSTEPFRP